MSLTLPSGAESRGEPPLSSLPRVARAQCWSDDGVDVLFSDGTVVCFAHGMESFSAVPGGLVPNVSSGYLNHHYQFHFDQHAGRVSSASATVPAAVTVSALTPLAPSYLRPYIMAALHLYNCLSPRPRLIQGLLPAEEGLGKLHAGHTTPQFPQTDCYVISECPGLFELRPAAVLDSTGTDTGVPIPGTRTIGVQHTINDNAVLLLHPCRRVFSVRWPASVATADGTSVRAGPPRPYRQTSSDPDPPRFAWLEQTFSVLTPPPHWVPLLVTALVNDTQARAQLCQKFAQDRNSEATGATRPPYAPPSDPVTGYRVTVHALPTVQLIEPALMHPAIHSSPCAVLPSARLRPNHAVRFPALTADDAVRLRASSIAISGSAPQGFNNYSSLSPYQYSPYQKLHNEGTARAAAARRLTPGGLEDGDLARISMSSSAQQAPLAVDEAAPPQLVWRYDSYDNHTSPPCLYWCAGGAQWAYYHYHHDNYTARDFNTYCASSVESGAASADDKYKGFNEHYNKDTSSESSAIIDIINDPVFSIFNNTSCDDIFIYNIMNQGVDAGGGQKDAGRKKVPVRSLYKTLFHYYGHYQPYLRVAEAYVLEDLSMLSIIHVADNNAMRTQQSPAVGGSAPTSGSDDTRLPRFSVLHSCPLIYGFAEQEGSGAQAVIPCRPGIYHYDPSDATCRLPVVLPPPYPAAVGLTSFCDSRDIVGQAEPLALTPLCSLYDYLPFVHLHAASGGSPAQDGIASPTPEATTMLPYRPIMTESHITGAASRELYSPSFPLKRRRYLGDVVKIGVSLLLSNNNHFVAGRSFNYVDRRDFMPVSGVAPVPQDLQLSQSCSATGTFKRPFIPLILCSTFVEGVGTLSAINNGLEQCSEAPGMSYDYYYNIRGAFLNRAIVTLRPGNTPATRGGAAGAPPGPSDDDNLIATIITPQGHSLVARVSTIINNYLNNSGAGHPPSDPEGATYTSIYPYLLYLLPFRHYVASQIRHRGLQAFLNGPCASSGAPSPYLCGLDSDPRLYSCPPAEPPDGANITAELLLLRTRALLRDS